MKEDNGEKTSAGGKPVLLVDDEATLRSMLEVVLRKAGFSDVVSVGSGEEAVEVLERLTVEMKMSFEFALLDIVMPGIDGFAACAELKRIDPGLPVALMSAYSIEDIHEKVLACGADDFIPKPFNLAELVTRATMLARRREQQLAYEKNNAGPNGMPGRGDVIDGFKIMSFLGWGGASLVYKVKNMDDGGIFAMKMLSGQLDDIEEATRRFDNEVEITRLVKHENIVAFDRVGKWRNSRYFTMEYVDGVDMEKYMLTQGSVELNVLAAVSLGISKAIGALHQAGVIHRDIKLNNILYATLEQNAKLTDFGISHRLDSQRITKDGLVLGTPLYMAPEIFAGDDGSESSDIYSFGAAIYHLATGRPPFKGRSNRELAKRHHDDPVPPIRVLRREFNPELDDFITKICMAKKPSDRPGSMMEVTAELEAHLEGVALPSWRGGVSPHARTAAIRPEDVGDSNMLI